MLLLEVLVDEWGWMGEGGRGRCVDVDIDWKPGTNTLAHTHLKRFMAGGANSIARIIPAYVIHTYIHTCRGWNMNCRCNQNLYRSLLTMARWCCLCTQVDVEVYC